MESNYPSKNQAATKIQAEVRGFLARRHVQQMKKEGDDAAKKIQAHIRPDYELHQGIEFLNFWQIFLLQNLSFALAKFPYSIFFS
ncbi:unnamed protein product [Thelazia callipaeda]|uniref:Uncharacterized protein n=1 Tax=Thelazia callipaeda TaxID=103827 RepID=A0A0N5CS06_THECL|nr:unnamed protein product [Thelazia callipaeda]